MRGSVRSAVGSGRVAGELGQALFLVLPSGVQEALESRVQGLLTDVNIVIQSIQHVFSVHPVFIDHSHVKGQFIFNEGTKTIQWGKNNLLN